MQLPPSIAGTPNYGSTPVSQASGNVGSMAQAMAAIRQAITIISAQIPKLAPGSKVQTKITSALKMLVEAAPESEASPGVQKTEALSQAQQTSQQNPIASLMRAMGGSDQPQQQAA